MPNLQAKPQHPLPQGTSWSNWCLVASPSLSDGLFDQTVIYLVQHDESGAMGFVINQDLPIELQDLLGQLDIKCTPQANRPVLGGGPVSPEVGFVLHKGEPFWASSFAVESAYCVTTSKDILQAIAKNEGVNHFEMLLGYAGWAKGQLEQEFARGDWYLCPASDELLFSLTYDARWRHALNLVGIHSAWLADEVGHA